MIGGTPSTEFVSRSPWSPWGKGAYWTVSDSRRGRTHNLSRRAAEDLRLRPRGHWDRPKSYIKKSILILFSHLYPYIHETVHRNWFLLNNQPEALVIQIYSVIKLHVSGIFSAHHQEFPTVQSAMVSFMQVWWPLPSRVRMELQFHPDSAWKRSSKACMKLTSAECTAENSWWWAEKMAETCRIL